MIPKRIHYCWFGPKPFPKTVQECISTWKVHLPDYQFVLWNESNSPMHHPFVKQAYEARKYAFVADYVRLWALYHEGGIYLDTDMYVVKSFNELLVENVFFGYETQIRDYISGGIMGAQINNPFISILLAQYDSLKFENANIDQLKIPLIITKAFLTYKAKETIQIFPFDYFYPFPFEKRHEKNEFLHYATDQTYAIHLWDLSWFTWEDFVIQKYHNFRKKVKL